MTYRQFTRTWRHWALATLMIWVLFGCSRCNRRNQPVEGLATEPLPSDSTRVTEETTRPLWEEGVIIDDLEAIYFDYDSEALDAEDQARLERNADWLRENPNVAVLVEGHCDERGTDEYNYNLGQRRANAVMSALRAMDVPTQLAIRSYGETRPVSEGHNESSWWQNRRVVFSSAGMR